MLVLSLDLLPLPLWGWKFWYWYCGWCLWPWKFWFGYCCLLPPLEWGLLWLLPLPWWPLLIPLPFPLLKENWVLKALEIDSSMRCSVVSCVTREPINSSVEKLDKTLDSRIVVTTILNFFGKLLRIFSTMRWSVMVSPVSLIWFTMLMTRHELIHIFRLSHP